MFIGTSRDLTDVINERHENVRYLPGKRLPDNVVAVPDLAAAADGADVIIFCLPHQFVAKVSLYSYKKQSRKSQISFLGLQGNPLIRPF